MNVLLIGSGGREHALAWKMAQSPLLDKFYITPGNPGTSQLGRNIDLDINKDEDLDNALNELGIDLVIVGPEAPLVDGIHDRISSLTDGRVGVIGPQAAGAQLEGSKDFSKVFMQKHDIPTARYQTFDRSSLDQGLEFLETLKSPYVLKCDGLAAGKGVLILNDIEEAKHELTSILTEERFGQAGAKVVIEEFLDGVELSVFILTDGRAFLTLPTAKDYKRIGEGDLGPNTGGMGALSPAPAADEEFMRKVEEQVIRRTLNGLQNEGIPYQGFLFIGLMRVGDEPFVIEYNVRMGDPETEAVMPRIGSDILAHFKALAQGELDGERLDILDKESATVMMVSEGYPGGYEKGKNITLDPILAEDIVLFHAGTRIDGDELVTNGGRVIASTGLGDHLLDALERAYSGVGSVSFTGKTVRRDIGYELKQVVK